MRWLLGVFVLCACDGDHIDVTWSFKNLASGETTQCPDGFPIAEVYVTKWYFVYGSEISGGWRWSPGLRRLYAVADCEDGGATTMELPYVDWDEKDRDFDLGYSVDVAFLNDAGERWGRSASVFQSTKRGSRAVEPVHLELVDGGGRFSFAEGLGGRWTWCNGKGGVRINLDAADGVRSEVLPCAGIFPYDSHRSPPNVLYTNVYPAGDYRIWIDGLDTSFEVFETWKSDAPLRLGAHNDIHWLDIKRAEVTVPE